jgi:hypothetical protein
MFKRTPKNEQPRPSRALAIRTPVPEVAEGNPPGQDGSGPTALRDEFEVVITRAAPSTASTGRRSPSASTAACRAKWRARARSLSQLRPR